MLLEGTLIIYPQYNSDPLIQKGYFGQDGQAGELNSQQEIKTYKRPHKNLSIKREVVHRSRF